MLGPEWCWGRGVGQAVESCTGYEIRAGYELRTGYVVLHGLPQFNQYFSAALAAESSMWRVAASLWRKKSTNYEHCRAGSNARYLASAEARGVWPDRGAACRPAVRTGSAAIFSQINGKAMTHT